MTTSIIYSGGMKQGRVAEGLQAVGHEETYVRIVID